MKRMVNVIFLALMVLFVSTGAFAKGPGGNSSGGNQGSGSNGNQGGGLALYVQQLPYEAPDAVEIASLKFMREEEKVARDLYLAFYETWKLRIFSNIAASEQRHMDAILALLDKYGIADPASDLKPGEFADSDLQDLYDNLLAKGTASQTDALSVGALVEEVDIDDLALSLKDTDNEDIKTVYQNLMKGSRNHLRSYVSVLEALTSEDYVAQHLPQETVDAIIDSTWERGMVDQNGEPIVMGRGGRQ